MFLVFVRPPHLLTTPRLCWSHNEYIYIFFIPFVIICKQTCKNSYTPVNMPSPYPHNLTSPFQQKHDEALNLLRTYNVGDALLEIFQRNEGIFLDWWNNGKRETLTGGIFCDDLKRAMMVESISGYIKNFILCHQKRELSCTMMVSGSIYCTIRIRG
eukprot:TRINITY_DN3633_c1_g4_i2.p1 TRINITY_DN3633_c1_g4~~TRINITY_DN3633_c1_g4_i2.p1  ORF type:complete len:157 (+),score=11.62 TRINITY_DN3633_c1_g4_i2:273-743(+)